MLAVDPYFALAPADAAALDAFADVPATIEDIEAQIRWEMDGVNRGVRRYRRALEEGGDATTTPGKNMLVEIIGNAAPAIAGAQEQALAALLQRAQTGLPKRPVAWWAPITLLVPEALAFITARLLLCSREGAPSEKHLAALIGRGVVVQAEYEQWREREHQLSRDARKAGDLRLNMARLMDSRAGKIDEATVRKWTKGLDTYRKLDLDRPTRWALGTKLIELVVAHGGGWFEIAHIPKAGANGRQTHRVVRLTEAARAWLVDAHGREELNRPMHLPMIAPPVPWRKPHA